MGLIPMRRPVRWCRDYTGLASYVDSVSGYPLDRADMCRYVPGEFT